MFSNPGSLLPCSQNAEVYYRILKSSPLETVRSQTIPVQKLNLYLWNSMLILFSHLSRSLKWNTYRWTVMAQISYSFVKFSILGPLHIQQSLYLWSNHPKNVREITLVTKSLIKQFLFFAGTPFLLVPQHPILLIFPWCEKISDIPAGNWTRPSKYETDMLTI
jgi:hypothetical protein